MPFKSDAQRRYLYAKKPEIAKEFAEHTPKDVDLPDHVKHAAKKRALRRVAKDNY